MKSNLIKSRQFETRLLECLEEVPFLDVARSKRQSTGKSWQPDILLQAREGSSQKRIAVVIKDSGQPSLFISRNPKKRTMVSLRLPIFRNKLPGFVLKTT